MTSSFSKLLFLTKIFQCQEADASKGDGLLNPKLAKMAISWNQSLGKSRSTCLGLLSIAKMKKDVEAKIIFGLKNEMLMMMIVWISFHALAAGDETGVA